MIKQFINSIRKSENIYSLIGNVVYAAFALAGFLIMVRLLDKDLYGRWVIYLTAASLLDMIRLGLSSTATIRLISISDKSKQEQIIASSYQLSLLMTFAIWIIFWLSYLLIHSKFEDSYYTPVLLYYPLLAIANIGFNQANTISQGLINFKRVLIIRSTNGILTFVFTIAYIAFFRQVQLSGIILSHIIANLFTSAITSFKKWDGLLSIKKAKISVVRKILDYGKFSTASSLGSNLLRSSDTILLSMSSVMGAQAIAIYAIPLKIVEFVEIPLRSFTATAFPKLSQAFKNGKDKFNIAFSQYLGATVILLFPVLIVLLIKPQFFLQLLGGDEYLSFIDLQVNIFYVIIAYIFILPFDRYTGMALFALDKPKINFQKIMIMLLANLILDGIAIFVFNSLVLVAFATFIFTFIGIILGWYYIQKETGITFNSFMQIIQESVRFVIKKHELVK